MQKPTTETIAHVVHEAIRTYNKTIGDPDDAPWEEAPEKLKLARRKGVEDILENAVRDPAAIHQGWLEEKQRQGWSHGNEKNREKKTHHCLLPWPKLPQHQQLKAYLFMAITRAMVLR